MFTHLTAMSHMILTAGYYGWLSTLVGGAALVLGTAISAWRDA